MKGKRDALATVWHWAHLTPLAVTVGATMSPRLRILAYHRVLDIGDEDSYPADPELVSASVEDFEWQMAHIKRHFEPVRFSDVLAASSGGPALPRRAVMVTFDDGHLDNHTHAFPVLRRLGVPACIFLTTGYIGGRTMFWFDRVCMLLMAAPPGSHPIAALDLRLELADAPSRRQECSRLLSQLKVIDDPLRRAVLADLEQRFAPCIDPSVEPQRPAMNWDEVREMAAAGIEFGSHSVSHPVLTRLDDDALHDELLHSREEIQRQTGQDLPVLAYPVGKGDAHDQRIARMAVRCGYRLGVSYDAGTNPLRGFEPFTLRRLAVERYTSRAYFDAMLGSSRLFAR